MKQTHWPRCTGYKPVSDVAQWLDQHLLHMGQKTMWAVAHWWGLPLTFEEVNRAQKECLVCSKRDLHQVPHQHGTIVRGPIPIVRWQIDYIGPLPISEGYWYAMTCVDMATGLLVAFPAHRADQQTTKRGLECLSAAYGWPQVIESDQGTHFTGHGLQQWVQQLGIKWKFHVPYNPTGQA